ncbi:PREDICTED: pancreatic triacylglycerol lipase-like isoform X2 [Papilio polytes]|uniref:pancreatic triacylglycerol lipase-like isoform X2 n=1 Tax=Papilio polytes TaxID=76194 RepID=UPI00067673F1|nr:PREDICTED: pancreatic triacylglycerol lipase-like isoform X2 [Papilio polytes]
MRYKLEIIYLVILNIIFVTSPGMAQRNASLPLSPYSFRNILRAMVPVPRGRVANSKDVRILYYGDISEPAVYHYATLKQLLAEPEFDITKPTSLYIHGYVEQATDDSILTVVRAYQRRGGHNFLLLDWSNLGFGNYINVILDLKLLGEETAKAMAKLLKGGLPIDRLHLIGHSLGAHLGGFCCRYLKTLGYKVPRLTVLDAAYPGFYPALFLKPLTPQDARFVDVIHTDGGGFGAPSAIGHADFWPNEGRAKQPGCLPLTVPLTVEDFCSHWRSWRFWAESVEGGVFAARRCTGYDAFLRGHCHHEPIVLMGYNATPMLRGNYYLRTAAESPFALGERGAD